MIIYTSSIARKISVGVTIALLGGVLAPIATATSANAADNGEYICSTGLLLGDGDNSPTYTISNGVVSSGSDCIGAVVISESATSIGTQAFYGSTRLTSITIPASVTSIGSFAFSYTSALSSVTIPESVTSIEDNAFYNATALTSVTLRAGITTIGVEVFTGTSLTSITIPESVTSIGDYAFSNTRSLTSVTIPASVTSIGRAAFAYTTSLSSITIPASVTSIDSGAFEGADALNDVYFLGNAPTVGNGVFFKVNGAVAHIKANATGFGSELTWNGLVIDRAIAAPADGSYVCTTGLLREVSDNSPTFTITDGVVSDGSSCSGAVVIPEGVTSIGTYAFYDAQSLTGVTLPSTLLSLGNYAFERTTSLKSISIPARVTSIGVATFYSTRSLESITFAADSKLTTIGDSAFIGSNQPEFINTVLTSISIPAGVTSIGATAFPEAISSLYFLGNAPNVSASTFNFVASGAKAYITTEATGFGDDDYWNGLGIARLGTYTVTYNYNSATGGDSVATGSFATFGTPITLPSPTRNGYLFAGWYSDAELTSKIGNAGASYSPTGANLSKIVYANWVEPVFATSANGDETVAITGCTDNCFGDLVIPGTIGGKTVTSIGSEALAGKGITSVTIPNSVTSIGATAFAFNE